MGQIKLVISQKASVFILNFVLSIKYLASDVRKVLCLLQGFCIRIKRILVCLSNRFIMVRIIGSQENPHSIDHLICRKQSAFPERVAGLPVIASLQQGLKARRSQVLCVVLLANSNTGTQPISHAICCYSFTVLNKQRTT